MNNCKTTGCGSYAINHQAHGRDGSDGDLCDVCYWRKRASQGEQASKQKSRETNKALAKPLSDVFRNFGKEPEIMPLIDAYATARGEVGNEHFSHECFALREQIRTKLLGEQASKRVALTDADCYAIADDFKSTYQHGGPTYENFDMLGFARAIEAHSTGEKTE